MEAKGRRDLRKQSHTSQGMRKALRARKGKEIVSPLELAEESSPTHTLTLAQQADLEILASRTVREYVFVVLNH